MTIDDQSLAGVHGGYDPSVDWGSSELGYGLVVPEYSEDYPWPPSALDEDLEMGAALGAPMRPSRALDWDV